MNRAILPTCSGSTYPGASSVLATTSSGSGRYSKRRAARSKSSSVHRSRASIGARHLRGGIASEIADAEGLRVGGRLSSTRTQPTVTRAHGAEVPVLSEEAIRRAARVENGQVLPALPATSSHTQSARQFIGRRSRARSFGRIDYSRRRLPRRSIRRPAFSWASHTRCATASGVWRRSRGLPRRSSYCWRWASASTRPPSASSGTFCLNPCPSGQRKV